MTQDEIQILLKSSGWDFIGKGSFNKVYRSQKELTINDQTCYWVLKKPIKPSKFDAPERVVRKWNEINPEKPAVVTKHGWIAPYLGDKQATDEQIASELVNIYRRTGNIIADACAPKNFLYFDGATYCVDFDHSFKRGSKISDDYEFYKQEEYQECFNSWADLGTPLSVSIIHALAFLETLAEPEIIKKQIIAKGFLTVRILAIINNYRMCKESLDVLIQHLPFLAQIEQIDRDGHIPIRFIIPSFVASMIEESCEDITFELLEQWLATHMILAPQIESQSPILELYTYANDERPMYFIETEDLDGIRLLFKCDNEFVHQRYPHLSGLTALQRAAGKGKSNSVRELIDLGADVYARTAFSYLSEDKQLSALELAIISHRGYAVKILVEKGYHSSERAGELLEICKNNPEREFSLFIIAVQEDMLELLMQLLKANPAIINRADNLGRTALIHAVMRGHLRIIQYLIEQKADTSIKTKFPKSEKEHDFLNKFTLADWALYYGHQQIVLFLNSQYSIDVENNFLHLETLIEAIMDGDLVKVQWLLPRNSPLLQQRLDGRYTALHFALMQNQDEIADYLIRAGSDIIMQTVNSSIKSSNTSAWFMALYGKRTRVIRSCLEHSLEQLIKADLFLKRAMMQAAELGLIGPIKRLVGLNPQLINVTDPHHRTPISLAIIRGHTHVVQFLIQKGARLNIPFNIPDTDYCPETPFHGYLPLALAHEFGNTEIIRLLIIQLSHQADETRHKAAIARPAHVRRTNHSPGFFLPPAQTPASSSSSRAGPKYPFTSDYGFL